MGRSQSWCGWRSPSFPQPATRNPQPRAGIILLLVVLVPSIGCLGTVAQVVVAPESVVAGTAADLGNAASSSITGADLGSLSDRAGTIADLDRIIHDHPTAENIPQLETLRDQLAMQQRIDDASGKPGSSIEPIVDQPYDRRATPSQSNAGRWVREGNLLLPWASAQHGHRLLITPVQPIESTKPDRRDEQRGFAAGGNSSLDAWQPRAYAWYPGQH